MLTYFLKVTEQVNISEICMALSETSYFQSTALYLPVSKHSNQSDILFSLQQKWCF